MEHETLRYTYTFLYCAVHVLHDVGRLVAPPSTVNRVTGRGHDPRATVRPREVLPRPARAALRGGVPVPRALARLPRRRRRGVHGPRREEESKNRACCEHSLRGDAFVDLGEVKFISQELCSRGSQEAESVWLPRTRPSGSQVADRAVLGGSDRRPPELVATEPRAQDVSCLAPQPASF